MSGSAERKKRQGNRHAKSPNRGPDVESRTRIGTKTGRTEGLVVSGTAVSSSNLGVIPPPARDRKGEIVLNACVVGQGKKPGRAGESSPKTGAHKQTPRMSPSPEKEGETKRQHNTRAREEKKKGKTSLNIQRESKTRRKGRSRRTIVLGPG